jgi:hypothetical protein
MTDDLKRVAATDAAPNEVAVIRKAMLPWPIAVFKDPNEPDAGRRYKVVQFDRHQPQVMAAFRGESDMNELTVPGRLYVSPDGSEVPTMPSGPLSQIHDTVVFP